MMVNLSILDFEPTKITSRARFFAEIEPHLPIAEWINIIKPHYYPNAAYGGNTPKPLEIMLRTYLVQNFFTLSDEACEDAVHEILSVRKFVGITANDRDIPDKSTICRFRNLLVRAGLTDMIFKQVVCSLTEKGLILKKGTIVDSTIIDNSTSKRNKEKSCDPESSWTKKGGNYRHGFKSHIGVCADSGLVSSNETTTAKTHDVTVSDKLLHGEEEAIYGDSGYLGMQNHVKNLDEEKCKIMKRPTSISKLDQGLQGMAIARQYAIASIRAKCEHPFSTIKRLFGFRRTRYVGLIKNAAKLNILYALANIWKISRAIPLN